MVPHSLKKVRRTGELGDRLKEISVVDSDWFTCSEVDRMLERDWIRVMVDGEHAGSDVN